MYYDYYTYTAIDDKSDVLEQVQTIAASWNAFGLALGLKPSTLNDIDKDCTGVQKCLDQVVEKWLLVKYDNDRYGNPTWNNLIKAVRKEIGGGNPALAQQIKLAKEAELKKE